MKLLGIRWKPIRDTTSYAASHPNKNKRFTKRIILSQIAQLYDPLGLLGPILTKTKLILRQLCQGNIDWDESIPLSIYTSWCELQTNLPSLKNIPIPRRIKEHNSIKLNLHGFCDASEKAYGAYVYLQTCNVKDERSIRLVCAKSRVALSKKVSLPRLELCTAVLLTNLYVNTTAVLKLDFKFVHFLADSSITLSRMHSESRTLKTFVVNRVSDMQLKTHPTNWNRVPTDDNPADFISSGQFPKEFLQKKLWIHDPHRLLKEEKGWPKLQNLQLMFLRNVMEHLS